MGEKAIGVVENYFAKIGVAAIILTDGSLKTGDTVRFKGATTDLTQTIKSMQVEHNTVESAETGDMVGLKVTDRVRSKDTVYLIVEEE